jgi:DNA-binding beta-propeller fold protein YncE
MRAAPQSAGMRRRALMLALGLTFGAAPALRSQPAGVALIANQESGSATLIDLATGASTEIPVGTGPHEAVVLPGARRGVVTLYGDRGTVGHQLAVIDVAARCLERTVELGMYSRPHGVAAVAGQPDLVAVTSETTRNVLLVNVATGRVERVIPTDAPGSHMIAVAGRGQLAGVAAWTANVGGGSISELDLSSGALRRGIPVATMTEGIGITPDGKTALITSAGARSVILVDLVTRREIRRFPVGLSPDGVGYATP